MSNASNDNGRAFEYACIMELKDIIEDYRPVKIVDSSINASLRAWKYICETDLITKNNLLLAANAYIETLFQAEPLILEYDGSDEDIIELSINTDSAAEAGDVRDIIINRKNVRWDIGLSLKHNHFAVKHSRLSPTIDFGLKWYNVACDSSYWEKVNIVFNELRILKNKNIKWNEMADKEQAVYVPILKAFCNELMRAYALDRNISSRLIEYLIGTRDFYKVVAMDKRYTEFQPFNLRGELNRSGVNKPKRIIPIAPLPDEIIQLRFKPNSNNTIELYLNNGWALSFRIHNASTYVETSLKFDIQFIGVPSKIITINCSWK